MIDEKKIEEAADEHCSGTLVQDILRRASFKAGINWFKENLWHDAIEEPKHGLILVEFNGDMESFFALHQSKKYTKLIHVSRWLHIEDLMKEGK